MPNTNSEDIEAQPSSLRHPGVDHVITTDSLKSLAHPLRVRIYDELSAYGPLTASGLAERLGESSGSTSYHLRQLERTGLIREDTTRGKGRERWWERTPGSIAIPDARSLPPGSAERLAVRLVEDEWFRSRDQNFHEFLSEGVADIDVVLMKYIDAYKRTPTPGSRPVQIQINAFPLVRGEATEDTPKG